MDTRRYFKADGMIDKNVRIKKYPVLGIGISIENYTAIQTAH